MEDNRKAKRNFAEARPTFRVQGSHTQANDGAAGLKELSRHRKQGAELESKESSSAT